LKDLSHLLEKEWIKTKTKMSKEIKEKIKELKDKHFKASNRNWVRQTNGLSQRETLDKLQSQVDILEELLNEEPTPETKEGIVHKYFKKEFLNSKLLCDQYL